MKILQEDYDLVQLRIGEIKQNLRDLAVEFHEVLNQSSETWHDNAPWDAAKGQEAVYLAELESLQKIANSSRIFKPDGKSPIGQFHTVKSNDKEISIFLAGDFSLRNGQKLDGHIIVTTDSPIAQSLLSN